MMEFKEPLVKLVLAAHNHGKDSGSPDQAVTALQSLLKRTWCVMTVSQKLAVLNSDEARSIATIGGGGELNLQDEVAAIKVEIDRMDLRVKGAGYIIHASNHGYFWAKKDQVSMDFRDYADAVVSAYTDLKQSQ